MTRTHRALANPAVATCPFAAKVMMGAVVGTFASGQAMSRLGTYKTLAMIGSVMVAAGMMVFAQMNPGTPRLQVVIGMIMCGCGMGLLMPVYTVAVQNVAPSEPSANWLGF